MKGCVKAAIETEQIDTKEKDAYTSDIEGRENNSACALLSSLSNSAAFSICIQKTSHHLMLIMNSFSANYPFAVYEHFSTLGTPLITACQQ